MAYSADMIAEWVMSLPRECQSMLAAFSGAPEGATIGSILQSIPRGILIASDSFAKTLDLSLLGATATAHLNSAPQSPRVSRPEKPVSELCLVCGDRATGVHYKVATCDGCKTFFRRSVSSKRRFECFKEGHCDFGKNERCACRACRFRKCVNVGMNAAGINHYNRDIKRKQDRKLEKNKPNPVVAPKPFRPITPLPPPSIVNPAPWEDTIRFAIGIAEYDELISSMLTIDARMSQMKSRHFVGGQLLDLLTSPPAIECMHEIQPFSPPLSFASEYKRIEYWLNYELTIVTKWMKTHAVFRKLTFYEKCTVMEDTMLAVMLLNAACEAALRGERQLRYSDGSEMRFSEQCGSVAELVDSIVYSSNDKATFVLIRAITFLNADAFGVTSDGQIERMRIMYALEANIFNRNEAMSPRTLGDILALPTIVLEYAQRVRLSPPAPAPLLFVKTPLPSVVT